MKGAIDRIQIQGFKSIRQADIRLNSLNVLIGPNGVGKSNFIDLFKLINNVIARRIGLDIMTGQCPHFARWVEFLKSL